MSHPQVELGALPQADGSARYSWHGLEIFAAVNGPIEVQRRDEIPDEAAIEVNVRPANGVGGTRERHIESLITSVLRSIILTKLHPRTLIQVTLQILTTPEADSNTASIPQSASHLPSLPHLLQSALLALLNGNIPLSKTFTVVLVGIDNDDNVVAWPSIKEMDQCASVHVFAESMKGETLLIESEGDFSFESFEEAATMARRLCSGSTAEDQPMEVEGVDSMQAWLSRVLEQDIKKVNQWKEHL